MIIKDAAYYKAYREKKKSLVEVEKQINKSMASLKDPFEVKPEELAIGSPWMDLLARDGKAEPFPTTKAVMNVVESMPERTKGGFIDVPHHVDANHPLNHYKPNQRCRAGRDGGACNNRGRLSVIGEYRVYLCEDHQSMGKQISG
jgi:hypothetical protein